jgi:hypothetical protein
MRRSSVLTFLFGWSSMVRVSLILQRLRKMSLSAGVRIKRSFSILSEKAKVWENFLGKIFSPLAVLPWRAGISILSTGNLCSISLFANPKNHYLNVQCCQMSITKFAEIWSLLHLAVPPRR